MKLEMRHIYKSFGAVKAVQDVDLTVEPGQIHGLLGENGAGKTTLMNVLAGTFAPDSGDILIDGNKTLNMTPLKAAELKIRFIHQELNLCNDLKVYQNMFLGQEEKKKSGLVDKETEIAKAQKVLDYMNSGIQATKVVAELDTAQKQLVEIARALLFDSELIIMDEPTTALNNNEIDNLFNIMRQLKSEGVSFIYISHKMEEIFCIADDITVLRDGQKVGTYSASDLNREKLIALMVGRESTQRFPDFTTNPGEVCLKVENLTSANPKSFKNISFELRKGEILGVGGLVGAQRTELMESVFGLRGIKEGCITINGKKICKFSPSNSIKSGIGLITEDRRGSGIFPLLSICKNTIMASTGNYKTKIGLLNHKKLNEEAEKYNAQLRTKTPSMETLIQNLSGGNQQKVIISRWLMTLPDILIMDEPTRGIDVGAKFEIYSIMAQLANMGKSIIMVSSEMPELIGMSDRIMVLCNGKLTGVLSDNNMTQENIMELAAQF